MKLSKMLALFALAMGALIVPPVDAEGWFNDLDEAKDATLGQVVANPHDYVDVLVKIKVYFDRTGSNYNPYYTRFSDGVYSNFAAWPINARLYEKRDFGRSYPFFFVQRMNKRWSELREFERVTPVEVVGVVREVFRGQPWIEVLGYKKLSDGLSSKDVRAVVRGDAFFARGKYADAVKSYGQVSTGRLPKDVRVDVLRRRGDAEFYNRDYSDAVDSYRDALKLQPKSEVLEQGLAAARDMAERARSKKVASKRAGVVVAPAPRSAPLASVRNDVDDIIEALEDPAVVKAEVEKDLLELEKRASKAREGEVAVVSGVKEETEDKTAAVEDQNGEKVEEVVVEDGVAKDQGEKAPGPIEDGCGEQPAEEKVKVEEPKDGCGDEQPAEEAEEKTEEVEQPEDGCGDEQPAEEAEEKTEEVEQPEDGCGDEQPAEEKTEEVEQPEDGCGDEQPAEEKTEEVEQPEDGCGDEQPAEEKTEEVEQPEDGCGDEQPAEEAEEKAVEVEKPAEEQTEEQPEGCGDVEQLVKDNEVREGETLVRDGVAVVEDAEVAEEGMEETAEAEGCGEGEEPNDGEEVEAPEDGCGDEQPAEEAEEEAEEKAPEGAEDVEESEDGCSDEQPAEEGAEEPEDGCADEQPAEEGAEAPEDGCADEQPAEEAMPEDGCAEKAQDPEDEVVVVDGEAETAEAVVVKDGEVVVKDGAAVVETVPAEEPARKTIEQLPRLPFFGCDDVTEDELRQVIEEILNSPDQ